MLPEPSVADTSAQEHRECKEWIAKVLVTLTIGISFGTLAPVLLLLTSVMPLLLLPALNVEAMIRENNLLSNHAQAFGKLGTYSRRISTEEEHDRVLIICKYVVTSVTVSVPNKTLGKVLLAALSFILCAMLFDLSFSLGAWLGLVTLWVGHASYEMIMALCDRTCDQRRQSSPSESNCTSSHTVTPGVIKFALDSTSQEVECTPSLIEFGDSGIF